MDAQPKIGGFGCFKGVLQIPFFLLMQFHKAIFYFNHGRSSARSGRVEHRHMPRKNARFDCAAARRQSAVRRETTGHQQDHVRPHRYQVERCAGPVEVQRARE